MAIEFSVDAGIKNLLLNCAELRAGERLLIAYEPPHFGCFDQRVIDRIVAVATSLSLDIDLFDVGFSPDKPHITPALMRRMEGADVTLFHARLGDQLRFSDMPVGLRIVVNYAWSLDLFATGFCNCHYEGFIRLLANVDRTIAAAQNIRVTCPSGTDFSGCPQMAKSGQGDVSIKRFPMSVFAPVPAAEFSGKVALPGFLTGTGSMYYEPYTVHFSGPVFATFERGRLTCFEGLGVDVARANAHYDFVADRIGIERNIVHSWHAGIHPGCDYSWDMMDSFERWGGMAFGNPRILHFHTCGSKAPGEISWNVIDPTVTIDGVVLWDKGVFRADRLDDGKDILRDYPCAAMVFDQPKRSIGIPALTA